uniref:G-protein coupled receptors family 3 profile domain-containing protein n=1 Tax=Globodera rostochiensis TaxID=31243 RepID=A0A914H5N1_GLORO
MFSLITMTLRTLTHVHMLAKAVDDAGGVYGGQPAENMRQLRIPGDLIIGGVFPVHAKGGGTSPCGEIFETRGVHRVEAFLYALDMINAQTEFLRGYKLGALILDSCSNPAYALNQSLDFVRDMIGSSELTDYSCTDGRQPTLRHPSPKKNVVAVVGASYSSVTVQIANLLRLFRIVQVSPASTNADLSDKNRFEYFARTVPSDNYQARAMIDIAVHFNWTYVSLVYSADEYGELGADAFKKEARRANICIAIEERVSMKPESLRDSIANLMKKLQPDKKEGARVVALFVGTEYIAPLLQQVAVRMRLAESEGVDGGQAEAMETARRSSTKKRIIWLASEGWDRNNEQYTLGSRKLAAEGAIVLMLESQRVPSFEEYYLSLHPGTERFERNKWLKELWRHKFNCEFNLPMGSTQNRCEAQRQSRENFSPDDKIQFVIEAVYAIAHALQSMKGKVCPEDSIEHSWIQRYARLPQVCPAMRHIDGAQFYKHLLEVKFEDLVKKRVHFSPQGDGPAHYTILNYQPFRRGKEAISLDRSDYVELGRWSEERLDIDEQRMFWNVPDREPTTTDEREIGLGNGATDEKMGTDDRNGRGWKPPPLSVCSLPCTLGFRKQLIKEDELCCWVCGKCEDFEYLPNEISCMDCGRGNWPTPDRKGCFSLAEKHLKYMRWNSWYSVVPIVLATVGIVATVAVTLIYTIHAQTPVVKASGRELSYVLLFSCLLCYSMTFVLLSKPSWMVCTIRRTGIGLAFSCLYSALLVKTNRIHRIFSQATRTRRAPPMISPISQLLLTSAFIGSKMIFSIVWLIVQPPGTRHIYPTRADVVLTCNVPDHHFLYSLAYECLLLIMCTVYAVKTRKVPENFNETRYIGFSMYTTCVLWGCLILFFFGTGSDFQLRTTALCMSTSMSANVALVCIFSPKIYVILFEKHKNVRKEGSGSMLNRKRTGSSYATNLINNNINNNTTTGCCDEASRVIGSSIEHHSSSPTVHTALLGNNGHHRRQSNASSCRYTEGGTTTALSSGIYGHDTFL